MPGADGEACGDRSADRMVPDSLLQPATGRLGIGQAVAPPLRISRSPSDEDLVGRFVQRLGQAEQTGSSSAGVLSSGDWRARVMVSTGTGWGSSFSPTPTTPISANRRAVTSTRPSSEPTALL